MRNHSTAPWRFDIMSRIGKQPIVIPSKVKVEVKGQQVSVEGPKGKLNWRLPSRTSLKMEGDRIVVSRKSDEPRDRALHGLSRALLNNMVRGVSEQGELVALMEYVPEDNEWQPKKVFFS